MALLLTFFYEAENQPVSFHSFAPTGQDSIAQGAALGYGTKNIGKPQRGVTPQKGRTSFAPLGLDMARGFVPQGCALGYRVSTLWAGKQDSNAARSRVFANPHFHRPNVRGSRRDIACLRTSPV